MILINIDNFGSQRVAEKNGMTRTVQFVLSWLESIYLQKGSLKQDTACRELKCRII